MSGLALTQTAFRVTPGQRPESYFRVRQLDGTKAYALAAIEHANLRIRVLGATIHPGEDWIVQQTRNLLMDLEETGSRVKFVLHDRDRLFHEGFDAVFTAAGVQIVRSGIRVPRMNAVMERWIGTCRRELLDRTLIWNIPHLRRILAEYERYYNEHRPHRTLVSAAPLTPLPAPVNDLDDFRVRRHDRIGGIIHEYQEAA
ncbi:integrase core domain-containing protein [Actinospica durhamensis]|uniref:Integrase core domain-containing protein n=1 Tax=Actinospica durhamensis TaxID=1508375 RepID=A0A941EYF1_9ACTN|nr:integrase core domain-containing protein [Actinospica durhamensis]MBR7839391.1 integrase core domain-containing protein [Actinospica durhamensis]